MTTESCPDCEIEISVFANTCACGWTRPKIKKVATPEIPEVKETKEQIKKRLERQKYLMAEAMEMVNRPTELTPEQKEKKERIEKMRAESYAKRKGSIYDVMPESIQREQTENERKYGYKIPPPEEL